MPHPDRHRMNACLPGETRTVNKKTFILLMTVFTLACALLFNTFFEEAKQRGVAHLNDEQMIHARQAAHGIEEFFATWIDILTSLSKMDEIVTADAAGRRQMELFCNSHRQQIRSITRMDETGTILFTFPYTQSAGSNISNQKHVQTILAEHRPVVSDVFKAVQGFDAVALHVPVFRGDEFKGSVAIVINFESLAKNYLEHIKIGKTGYAWVVSRDGTELYCPVPGHTGRAVFENGKDFPSIIAMANEMLKGNRGTTTYVFDRISGRKVEAVRKQAVYMPIRLGNTFWSIVVASSEEEMLASLDSFRNRLLMFMGTILVGGFLFSFLGAKAWLIVAEENKRKQAEEELRALNALLEERVAERTAQLENANRELEAFSSSVSHDLRAPLHHMAGYSGILLEDYRERLDEAAVTCLERIKKASEKMQGLIDSLLQLSHINQAKLSLQQVDLSRIAADIAIDLAETDPSRVVRFEIGAGINAEADPVLMQAMMQNLLGNAWKYTRAVPEAVITFSATERDGEKVYSVRDNGSGFDMVFAGNLFTPFQRLHGREFEGHGIGLATVQRIVRRHGGEIWGEGEPGKGATFFFTLKPDKAM